MLYQLFGLQWTDSSDSEDDEDNNPSRSRLLSESSGFLTTESGDYLIKEN